jgi:hypothetical protein
MSAVKGRLVNEKLVKGRLVEGRLVNEKLKLAHQNPGASGLSSNSRRLRRRSCAADFAARPDLRAGNRFAGVSGCWKPSYIEWVYAHLRYCISFCRATRIY